MKPRVRLFVWGLVLFASPLLAASQPSRFGTAPGAEFRAPHPVLLGGDVVNLDSGESFADVGSAVADADTLSGHVLEVRADVVETMQVVLDKSLTLRGETGTETVRLGFSTGSSGDSRGWFLLTAGNTLAVEDLAFDGSGFDCHQAFRLAGAATFDGVSFSNIAFPGDAGTAISTTANATVTDATFSSIGRVGVLFFGGGVTTGLVDGMVYTGKGAVTGLDYAVELSGGAIAEVRNSTITDCAGIAGDGSLSAGLLASTFFGAGTTATFTSNTLVGNHIGISSGTGIGVDTSIVIAEFNRVVDSAALGLFGNAPATAVLNWWGCNAGPGTVGCDEVGVGGHSFDPWVVLTLDAAGPFQVGMPTPLVGALDHDSDGIDVSGLGQLPDGQPLAFDSDLGAPAPATAALMAGAATTTWVPATAGSGFVSVETDDETVSLLVDVLPAPHAVEVPVLGPGGLVVMILALAIAGLVVRRRSRVSGLDPAG